jgi:hypothetical protein
MKSIGLFIVIAAALFTGGCKSSGSDAAIATDMCGCFNMLKDSLPAEAISVFEKAAAAEKPQEMFAKEMQNLKPDLALKVNAALMSTAKPGSAVNSCIKEMDARYKTNTNDQQVMAKKMIVALKDKKDCDIMLALLRMNLKN